ncbi:MAG: glycoside hydrolase family 25 protein [Lachnospiraceae bacterium]|nr:glycoside hydrolase family 25 protein [Lachnospiraceae bacterium]
MDSRLKKQVIAVAAVMVVFTVVTVFLANYIQTGRLIGQGRQRTAAGGADSGLQESAGNSTSVQSTADTASSAHRSGLALTQTEYGEYLLDLDKSKDPSAFLKDMDFFDKEIVTQRDRVEAAARELTLLAFSVNKDLRISIINGNNEVVSGYPFEIELAARNAEKTVYTDEDKDGTIYIDGVDAGSYEVKLIEYGEYETRSTGITVTVKDEIEYRILDDVSYLLKSEAEVDAEEEDTAVKDALADADSTETTEHLNADNAGFGIDVSKWNKEIDWKKVKEAGVEFAIIRCAYRGSSTGALVEDPYFQKNIEGAVAAGIKVGVYFFTQATTVTEAMEEASIAVSLVRNYPLAYPVFIDTEGAGAKARAANLDVDTRTLVCRTFCETVEAAGYNAGVYASKNWLLHNLDTDKLSNYYTWLAEYKGEATYEGNYDFWQYTSSGHIDGIDGRVDLNMGYVGFAARTQ